MCACCSVCGSNAVHSGHVTGKYCTYGARGGKPPLTGAQSFFFLLYKLTLILRDYTTPKRNYESRGTFSTHMSMYKYMQGSGLVVRVHMVHACLKSSLAFRKPAVAAASRRPVRADGPQGPRRRASSDLCLIIQSDDGLRRREGTGSMLGVSADDKYLHHRRR